MGALCFSKSRLHILNNAICLELANSLNLPEPSRRERSIRRSLQVRNARRIRTAVPQTCLPHIGMRVAERYKVPDWADSGDSRNSGKENASANFGRYIA